MIVRKQNNQNRGTGSKGKWMIGVGTVILLTGAWVVSAVKQSRVIGVEHRYNLVIATKAGQVDFVSIDPVEKELNRISWPSDLLIQSRSVGSYRVGELYQLGAYDQEAGEFVRRKVQGFMKMPLMGYVALNQDKTITPARALWTVAWDKEGTNLLFIDSLVMWWRALTYRHTDVQTEELVRAGVLVSADGGYMYQEGRLQQYLGTKVVDWKVATSGLTVAVVNESGQTGLAADMANFFGNVGMDVVAVRSGGQEQELTQVVIGDLGEERKDQIRLMFGSWFGQFEFVDGSTSEYRADILVKLGKDAEDLF